jgi:hypothetical protein
MGSFAKITPRGTRDVYAAFRRLDSKRRLAVAIRILKDEKLLADLYDHLLIRRAIDEPGPSMAWPSHRRKR